MQESENRGTGRRATKREALIWLCVTFTTGMLVIILKDSIFEGQPDFENAFYFAIYMAIAMSIASLVFRLQPEFKDEPALRKMPTKEEVQPAPTSHP